MRWNTNTQMIRPRVDIDETIHGQVEDYAAENGLRMSRAFAEIIAKGLEYEEGDD